MLMPAVALIDDQDGLITSSQARAQGVSLDEMARLVKSGAWVRIRRGVYADGELWASLDEFRARPLLRVRAARLTLWSTFVFSHDSAALAWDIGVPDASRALVHVTRPHVHGDRQRAGVKHHLAPYLPTDVRQAAGLPVLSLARTAIDMAREHGLMAGVAACDAVLRRGVTRPELSALADRMHCWPESRVVRLAIDMADAGAESYLESEARVVVEGLGLGRPHTQFGLRVDGRTVWCDMRIGRHVFEADGRQKYDAANPTGLSPDEVLWQEKRRQDFIAGLGLGISRITFHDCHAGRRAAQRRLLREYRGTVDRFGTSLDDLAPYIVRRR